MQSSRHSESAVLTSTDFILSIKLSLIIIRCKFFFLFLDREPTTWPANKCLQIIVCSCLMSSLFCLQIRFCSCVNETTLFSLLGCLSRKSGRSLCWPFRDYRRRHLLKNKLDDRMIKQLLNSIIAKYRDLSVSRRWILCFTTNKSRYFTQPRPISSSSEVL